jgi:Zn-dependent protease with chaperone function
MNKKSIFFVGIFAIHALGLVGASDKPYGRYYAELKAFKKSLGTEIMFDNYAHPALAAIQRDITIYKNLTFFQRFVRNSFLACDVVIVTPETMPLLYGYVNDICKKANIKTPTVFISRKDGFFNAFAAKLLVSSGAIVIGQRLMKEVSDEGLEAVVAHEIGHIKHNHVNKTIALRVINLIILNAFIVQMPAAQPYLPNAQDLIQQNFIKFYAKLYLWIAALNTFEAFIINKRFEKEADRFAYEANGKAKGIIEFFELLLKKEALNEADFVTIREMLTDNKQSLRFIGYYELIVRYYLAKLGHNISNCYRKFYHETFWGAHPSHKARIAAAEEYLAAQ